MNRPDKQSEKVAAAAQHPTVTRGMPPMWFLYAAFKYKTPRKIQETEVGEGAEREVGSLDLLIALP